MEKKNRYCSYCGGKITPVLVGAETKGDGYFLAGSRCNRETGERQYVKVYTCLKFKKSFYNLSDSSLHDNYFLDDIILLPPDVDKDCNIELEQLKRTVKRKIKLLESASGNKNVQENTKGIGKRISELYWILDKIK